MPDERLLVPVSRSPTLRQTVAHAVETALSAESGHIRFAFVHSPEKFDGIDEEAVRLDAAEELLSRVAVWVEEDADDRADRLTVETAHLGTDRYLFSPTDVAEVLAEDAHTHDIDRVVLDPEYDPKIGAPLLRPLRQELEERGLVVEEVPVGRPARRTAFLERTTPLRIGVLFGLSFIFYQILGGTFDLFDIVTGAVSATAVAVALSRVSLSRDPDAYSPVRIVRMGVYVPYLVWEIFKSNLVVAAVILNPRLPIEPRLARVRPAVWGALPVTTLANSITLTPGTLTVRVDGRELLIHTLIPSARQGLFEGSLERAVRFVFYGRRAMRIDSIEERGDAEVVSSERVADRGDQP